MNINFLKEYTENIISNNLRGLGIGDWGLAPIPNPQSPIPNIKFICHNQ